MNPDDITKAAPAIAQGATALAAAIPLTAIAKKMLGPAADEVAEMWRDQVRLYRYRNEIKCLRKAEKMAKDAGFTPQAVPIKLLFPLLEGASFEEDESLHDMWASLLANASSPDGDTVRPGFIAILKQLAPDEALVLKFIADRTPKHFGDNGYYPTNGSALDNPLGIEFAVQFICLDGLEAAQLVRQSVVLQRKDLVPTHWSVTLDGEGPYRLTDRGRSFLQACQPPKPKP